MKKEKRNNLRAVMGLCSLLCLTSCGKEEKPEMYIGYYPKANVISVSSFDDGAIYDGMISYDNLEKGAIKIVTLKQGDTTYEPKLMGIYQNESSGIRFDSSYSELYYIDLKTSTALIKYYWDSFDTSTEPTIEKGESLEIVEEENLFNYVFQSGWFEEAYPIDELITFYNEEVKENTDNKELELTY